MKICALCGAEAVLTYQNMKGYMEDTFFDVYGCSSCDTAFVDPLKSDENIYNYIYEQVERMPGYERYHRYSQLVKRVSNPLWYLCNSEGVYWAVKEALDISFKSKKDISILEIGSGLGYLTYSLNKNGYKTTGLDISKEAVMKAKEKYGDFYEVGDIFDSTIKQKQYDCIIMTEIIEHVEDPKAFILAALSFLKADGKLIVTTPNKSASPLGKNIWQSDFPPVHLWFFSEKSMLKIGKEIGKESSFIDFTEFTKKFYAPSYDLSIDEIQKGLPRLTKTGKIFPGREADTSKSKIFGIKGRFWLSYIRRRLKSKTISTRTTTLCVVFS